MKLYLKLFTPFALAIVIGSLTFAFAQSKGERGGKPPRGEQGEFGRMPPPDGFNPRMFEELGLTDDQKKQIQTLEESSRTASQTYFEKLRVIQEQIKDTTESEVFDEAQARGLLKTKAEIHTELELNRLKKDFAFRNLLTAEQIAKLDTLKAKRAEFRPNFPPPVEQK